MFKFRLVRASPARRLAGLVARLAGVLAVGLALVVPARERLAGRRRGRSDMRARSREVLTSLYDRYPQASSAARRRRGLQAIPLDRIVGTTRHPSQNTADFRPLRQLRGRNWDARWRRITAATERLEVLPPVELIKLGDEYFVADGHNRMAAAMAAGAVEIDADVTELVVPGAQSGPLPSSISSSLVGTEELRQAARGRHSRASQQRMTIDHISRRDLLRASGDNPRAAGEETDVHLVVEADAEDEAGDSGSPS
jgi:hypothetical protein